MSKKLQKEKTKLENIFVLQENKSITISNKETGSKAILPIGGTSGGRYFAIKIC